MTFLAVDAAAVVREGPNCEEFVAVRAGCLCFEVVLEGGASASHTLEVSGVRDTSGDVATVAEHEFGFIYVGFETHAAEKLDQEV